MIRNNLIAGNGVEIYGGGVYDCTALIESNTIVNNSAAQYGGGLSSCSGPVQNCIIWGNTAGNYPQLDKSSTPTYSCIQGWKGVGDGNISEDPQFVMGEYRLSPESPCIDNGKNEDWMWAATDLEGNARIFYGASSATVDMGAYEYDSFRFIIVRILRPGGGIAELTWSSRPGDAYTVWSCTDLDGSQWEEQATVPSQGEATTWSDPEMASARKFYRIEVQ